MERRDRDRDELVRRIEALQRKGFSRRQILRMTAGIVAIPALGGILAACGDDSGDEAADESATTASGGTGGSQATATTGGGAAPDATADTDATAADDGGTPAASGSGSGAMAWEPEEDVEIEYWQYAFESKVKLVDELIPRFQEMHPKITVKHVNHPYDSFRQQVQAAVQAGQGPDVLNVFYGWVPAYYLADFLKPLPEEVFPTETVQEAFFPMIESVRYEDRYYAMPTAVRTLGLFWNRDILAEAGFDAPPATWEELVDVAVATTTRGGDDALETAGFTWDPGGQGHSWWRSCLTRQNGQPPMSEDNTELFWTEPAALEAFIYYVDLNREHKVGETGFYEDGATAFQTGNAALHIDGSYRVGTYTTNAPDLPYSVAVLPEREAQASYASYWCNTITRKAEGDREMAAALFIDFLASEDVMREWTPAIGELPARVAIADEFADDEKLGAFVEQLPYSYADFFVDESLTRQAVLDALDRVLLEGADPEQSLTEAEEQVQQSIDEYWADVEG